MANGKYQCQFQRRGGMDIELATVMKVEETLNIVGQYTKAM